MSKQNKGYADSMNEIELIINKIEKGDIAIDELTEQVKKAMELINECKKKLQSTENDIIKIMDLHDTK
jgi:exodeoxyribonuclease VII small subunit